MFLLIFLSFSLVCAEEKEREIKVNGIGKMSVKADIADVRLGIEVEEKTAQDVERALSSQMPSLLDSLKDEKIEKLETGMLEIHPEYTQSSPPEIKSYRGRSEVSFSAPTVTAGRLIGKAFAAGANLLTQVKVRPSDASLMQARNIVLKEAGQNAMMEAELVLESLNLKKKEISSITVMPTDIGVPIYRNTEFAMLASKRSPDMKILEGEQIVQAQIEMAIKFRDK